MNIAIKIDRGEGFGSKTAKAKAAKAEFQSLAATEFPAGIVYASPDDPPHIVRYAGPVKDFMKAVEIKKAFLATPKTQEDKQKMNAQLRPIYEKSQEADKARKTK